MKHFKPLVGLKLLPLLKGEPHNQQDGEARRICGWLTESWLVIPLVQEGRWGQPALTKYSPAAISDSRHRKVTAESHKARELREFQVFTYRSLQAGIDW